MSKDDQPLVDQVPGPLPDRVSRLTVSCAGEPVGELIKQRRYSFRYAPTARADQAVSLYMPTSTIEYADGDLFSSMDMNLPEGYLFQRIVERFGKRGITKMHLLAMMEDGAVGRVGYRLEGREPRSAVTLDREQLLRRSAPEAFEELVQAYLGMSIGVAGVQPKVMLPSRASVPIPDLIVKAEGVDYPGLVANEFLCLSAAKAAELLVPRIEPSDDASLLLVDRFDLVFDGEGQPRRLGFEDMPALMGVRVHDRLSNRKYHGSYEQVVEVLRLTGGNHMAENLFRFFEQVVLSVMVRNGDAHLKNFGLLYADPDHPWLSPLYDVVTTSIYRYERPGGVEDVDRTMALRLRRKDRSKAYPTTEDLLAFGSRVCEVDRPMEVIERVADGMSETLAAAVTDERIPRPLLDSIAEQWQFGMSYVRRQTPVARQRVGTERGVM